MIPDYRPELMAILREARQLLAIPDNDFTGSGWSSEVTALGELDWFIDIIRGGLMPSYPSVCFPWAAPSRKSPAKAGGWQSFCIWLSNTISSGAAYMLRTSDLLPLRARAGRIPHIRH